MAKRPKTRITAWHRALAECRLWRTLTLCPDDGRHNRASTPELMRRAGHRSAAAALRYQHASEDRDKTIADALSKLVSGAEVVPIERSLRARRAHDQHLEHLEQAEISSDLEKAPGERFELST